ncbi:MAG TPA: hypothetical protein VH597_03105 [Verrucomicrobiae bacterium]|nr:hypothetical protein [Verrucomicrobiae bacterium]
MKRFSVGAILVAIQLFAGNAGAADKLQADLIPQGIRTRSESSIPVELRFQWSGSHILEGRLEVELRDGNQILERYRSGDLALTTGEQRFRMLLPPPIEPYSDEQVEAHLKFVAAHEVYDLDYSIISVPTRRERSLAVGWCSPRTGTDSQALNLGQNLQFERFAPPSDDPTSKSLVTTMVRLTPEDLSPQPLSYTAFDVMVLTAEGFAEAREGQLHGLARWVKGGGSLCVFVRGNLQPQHLSFLNELAGTNAGSPQFLADSAGNLLPGHEKMASLRSGLGRSVIVTGNDAIDPVVWRRASLFLWKFRGDQVQAIEETGHWEIATNNLDDINAMASQPSYVQNRIRQAHGRWPQGMTYGDASYSVQSTEFGGKVMSQLMPKTVRLIPFGALVVMLGLFLLMIGPLDYFVLGWLRRRRFTWVLFPATCLAFTVGTVVMANYYLGRHDQRRSLTVVDLGADGTPLRWNRYELVFAARDRQAVTEVKDALWTDVASVQSDWNIGNDDESAVRESGPPWYEGSVPVHFRTSEPIHQWRPVLNRVFSFEPPPVPLLPDWRAVEAAWPDLPAIRAKLSTSKPFAGDVCAISGLNSALRHDGTNKILSDSILQELCLADSSGLFALVSQVSPTGGANYEDLQGMDTQESDSALAIVTQNGDDIIVYRRFFHGN